MERGLTRSIRQSLMADSLRQAEEAATSVGVCLEPSTGENDPRGTYAIMKHWYWHASARAPNPFRTDMENVRKDFQTLYQREEPHPPGLSLATHMDMDQVNYNIPS